MMRSLWTAATGMAAQAMNVDVISNNLANVNTAGFKRSRANFQDLVYQHIKDPGADSSSAGTQVPTGIQVGLGTRIAGISAIFSEGGLQQTGNPLDLAIEGKGFFQVLMPNGQLAYTRAGSLAVDSQGQIVTPDGYPLDPSLTIPSTALNVQIGGDGTVSVTEAGGVTTTVGQIQLVDFSNPGGLAALGRGLFQESAASGAPTTGIAGENGFGTIGQGMIEQSNVNAVEEMVNLIAGQRAYEMNSKAITAADDMLHTANGLKR